MKGLIFQLSFVALFAIAVANQPVRLFVEKEAVVFDLSNKIENEWIIETEPNRILFLSFIVDDVNNEQQILSSLTITDANKPDVLLFPNPNNILSSLYSASNAVSIKVSKPSIHSSLISFRLKAEKAAPCPTDLGGSSRCGRVVDDLSCYCGLYTPLRNWPDTNSFCRENGMTIVSIETYEEDLALFTEFVGQYDALWIGAKYNSNIAGFVWDPTGKPLSPGYSSWLPGTPDCSTKTDDCVYYFPYLTTSLPAWTHIKCNNYQYGGICELQP